ncbi:hypothetical protein DDB_G0269522 [Dictyostelium discoideum AX4]|uniref:Transmembrane protein n=1 Tax=Dictyostelium discoideum TaxID=44689 RepID=Q55DU0_DICDI|nr:hypothetical protein DDB_G0269522 [Dictyostelium discoideum AX4]EAL72111.1 hypothetical protein DDB_G0269522 [Dictyostelium discoideum AX4]|eukprot:XP_646041.1 hypothetical protein DDB_G0269522 [Dictyostelium discoideum AX4]
MQPQKFIYPTSSPYQVIIKSKRIGYLKRRFQRDMPIELVPYVTNEKYHKTIKYLENVSKYTYIGQIVSFIPSVVVGAIMFGVGESKRHKNSDFTPIYWYIGIIILGISFIYILIALATIKSKYLKNLSYAVQKCHTEYTNEHGIGWTLKYVDFRNRKNRTRQKIWCELTIPNSANIQQPVPHPDPYGPNQTQQPSHYIPMNYYYSTQPNNNGTNPQQQQQQQQQYLYPGQGQQLGNGQPLPPPQQQPQQQQQQQMSNQPYYNYPNTSVIPIDNQPIDNKGPSVNLTKK